MIRYAFSLLILGATLSQAGNTHQETIAFAVDFHDVLAKSKFNMATGLKNIRYLPGIFRYTNAKINVYKDPENPMLCIERALMDANGTIPQGALELINMFEPDWAVINRLKELKKQGYAIFLFTNAGPQSLAYFNKQHPDILSLFDGVQNPRPENNWITKNSGKSFEQCKKMIESQCGVNTSIIMIDDSPKKLNMAEQCGMKTYRFKGFKDFYHFTKKYIPA